MTSNGNYAILHLACGRGGTGRRVRLRGVWETVWVQVPSTAPTKNDLHIHCVSLFFCKGVRDLNGTLRKQHSALFLVPGVIATALAAQIKAYETPAPVGLRSKSHRPHQQKMTCTFIVQVFFFCKGVRDLNGTLRKQHSALFLVPGVIATALAAQKKAFKTPAPVGLRSKSHRPHQHKRR